MPHLMWTDYMSRLVTQPYVRDSQPRIVMFAAPYRRVLFTLCPVPCSSISTTQQ
jgi:hypothetical protein